MALMKLALLALTSLMSAHTLLAKDGPSPVEKVLELLTNMADEVREDSEGEAKAYEKFSCFCQKTTLERSKSIEKHTKKIGVFSAAIADSTAAKKAMTTDLHETKAKKEQLMQEKNSRRARCDRENAQTKNEITDVGNAVGGLEDAIRSMTASRARVDAPAFLAVRANLSKTLMLADVMSKPSETRRKAIAFLQSNVGQDPMAGYQTHDGSNDIIALCKNLKVEYKIELDNLTSELEKSVSSCKQMNDALTEHIENAEMEIDATIQDIAGKTEGIAGSREGLLTRDRDLKEDELYLKDLTVLCEERANDWDQRSAARHLELDALEKATSILRNDVKTRESKNRAALLQNLKRPLNSHGAKTIGDTTSKVTATVATTAFKSPSFLQTSQDSSSEVRSHKFLGRGQLSLDARRDRALSTLRKAGQKLGSVALSTLALRAADDPFQKVKGLIQKLIERLLEESKAEASKKGFCDTELAKARKDRDFRWQESQDLSAALAKLEAKEEALTEEIKDLTYNIGVEEGALTETTTDRELDTKANSKTIATAEAGRKAVSEALVILKQAYKQLAKGQSLLQASPVNEAKVGPGFSGTYHGAQGSSKAVFALLEQIHDEFDRTMRTTSAAEEEAHRDFVDYTEAAKSSIASKETQKELDEQDLKTAQVSIVSKKSDLQIAVDLMDSALKELEQLKPTCIDTGMSFEDRVKARETEMAALQHALCLLDADADAQGSGCGDLE